MKLYVIINFISKSINFGTNSVEVWKNLTKFLKRSFEVETKFNLMTYIFLLNACALGWLRESFQFLAVMLKFTPTRETSELMLVNVSLLRTADLLSRKL